MKFSKSQTLPENVGSFGSGSDGNPFLTSSDPASNPFAAQQHTGAQSDDVEIANMNDYTKFATKSNAILWEDDYIQIGCKLETRNNLGRLGMFYGNKTSQPLNKFTPIITCPGALAVQLQAQAKPVEQLVAAGTQVQQLINFVCVQEFQKMPIMNIKFSFTDRAGALQNFDKNFYLPLFISKFFEPTNMTSEQFFTSWKSLGAASQEAQKIFNAQSPMETANIETKLKGFGVNLLTVGGPNPGNYVCVGIIHTQTQQLGILIRLESNEETKMYRLKIRSSNDTVVHKFHLKKMSLRCILLMISKNAFQHQQNSLRHKKEKFTTAYAFY